MIITRTKADGRKLVKIIKGKRSFVFVGEREEVLKRVKKYLSKGDYFRLIQII